jgi:hypothetical protein
MREVDTVENNFRTIVDSLEDSIAKEVLHQ